MRHPAPLPPQFDAAAFSVAKAVDAGVTRDRLKASDLVHPFRGVRVPRALLDGADEDKKFRVLCDAYQAKMPRGWFFSGPTAARIIGVPLPGHLEQLVVHVTAPAAFAPRGKFVVGHTAQGAETTWMFGRPVRVAAELWCELASVLTIDELIQAGDRMLSDKPVMLTALPHLARAVAAHVSGRGARKLRVALPQLREHVWSPRETWTRLVILRAGLPEPERNVRIVDAAGHLIAIGDLVYRHYKVVIEYEGERWHKDPWSGIDVDRYNKLALAGWTVIKVRKHHNAADVERMTREALVLKGWRG